ncbi:MAG: amino acid ABC transporter permease [Deltaproteobacteria bacterium]|nr:amino acid ABC transporter permease [Deltaproteobacteria bacterium]
MMESLIILYGALPYLLRGIAVGQVYGGRWLHRLAGVYIWFFRGVPLLVLLFLFYFGLCSLLSINLSAFTVSIIVLGLITSAYQSQIFRGAIMSLPEGQMKAARALGMSDRKAVMLIVLPQALRLSIPGWSNEYSIVLKDSAVTYALGVAEIMARAHFVASRTYEQLPLYFAAGVMFLILTYLGTKGLRILENKVRISGYSS